MSYKLAILSFGDAEGCIVGTVALMYQNKEPLDTIDQVLTSIASYLFAVWWEAVDPGYYRNQHTCSCCRQPLKITVDQDVEVFEEFCSWLEKYPKLTADELPSEGTWWPWNEWKKLRAVPANQTLEIDNAASTLPWFIDPTALFMDETHWLHAAWEHWKNEAEAEEKQKRAYDYVKVVGK
jgi:hypothetical protein